MPVNPLDPNLYDPNIVGLYANYRFYTTDLVTNEILADIPFKNVSYDRAIKTAGRFSGTIEVLPAVDRGSIYNDLANTEALDLYKTTMPGKTGLYVMRTDERTSQCVWGGVIWSRKYNVVSRELQVSASEFTSYLHHRIAWKTYNHLYPAEVQSFGAGSSLVTLLGYDELDPLTGNTPTLQPGASVKIEFYEIENWQYNGFYTVESLSPPSGGGSPDGSLFSVTIPELPAGTYKTVAVQLRANTVDYVKTLLNSTFIDYINISIPNDEIEPATDVDLQVVQTEVSDEVATVFVSGDHQMIVGQSGALYNMDDPDYNGTFLVESVIGTNGFTYTIAGVGDKAVAYPQVREAAITRRVLTDYIATVTTATPHGFTSGERVVISGLDDGQSTVFIFDGEVTIFEDETHPITDTQFSYVTAGLYNQADAAAPEGAKAVVTPRLAGGSYGSFPYNSDIFIGIDADLDDGGNVDPVLLRGFELRTIGEVLDKYSDAKNGFEYRVDCEYVSATDLEDVFSGRFTRNFKILPIALPEPEYLNGWLTAESFPGATSNVFEYPGNIDSFEMDESAEDVATRFWMSGNIPDLGDDASQPYAGASAKDLLSPSSDVLDQDPYATWPLLEVADSNNDVFDEEELYNLADRYLKESRPPVTKMTVSVNGSIDPKVGTYRPGDWCSVIVDDPFIQERIASPLEADRDILIRKIESIKVSVPNMPVFPEKVTLELIPEWEVDKRGE